MPMGLPEMLRDAMRGARVSMRALARAAGVSPPTLLRTVQGEARLGEDGLVRVAHALGIDPVYVLAAAGRLPRDVVAYLAARPELVERLAIHAAAAAGEARARAERGGAGEGVEQGTESGGATE